MTISLTIPDLLMASLAPLQPELPRMILESFAVQGYRQGILSTAQVRTLLGHDSRWETEDFLTQPEAWPDPSAPETASGARVLGAWQKPKGRKLTNQPLVSPWDT